MHGAQGSINKTQMTFCVNKSMAGNCVVTSLNAASSKAHTSACTGVEVFLVSRLCESPAQQGKGFAGCL